MKKHLLLISSCFLAMILSCQDQESDIEPNTNIDFEEASAFLSDMIKESMVHTVNNADIQVDNMTGNIRISNPGVSLGYLKHKYFSELPEDFKTDLSNATARIESESGLTEVQTVLVSEMETSMNEFGSAHDLYVLIEELRQRIINHPRMTDIEKFQVLGLVEYTLWLQCAQKKGAPCAPLLRKTEINKNPLCKNNKTFL